MTVETIFASGGYLITDIIDGEYVKHRYFGYTKREAKALFREEYIRARKRNRSKKLS